MTSQRDHVIALSKALHAETNSDQAIADALYNHVREAVDLDALFNLEQLLWCVLGAVRGEDDDDDDDADCIADVAARMIRDALVRLADDGARYFSDVPYGVTKDEAKAVAYDDGCPFCVMEAARPVPLPEHVEGECECCDLVARDWRQAHAEILARAGLAPRVPARAAPS